jgi:hypothetical protein
MKVGREIDIPRSVSRAVDGPVNAGLLTCAPLAERTFFKGRTTAQRPCSPTQRRAIGVRMNRMLTEV